MGKVIVIATGNSHKVEEFNRLARVANLCNVGFVSAKNVIAEGMPHVEENANSFEGNAHLKASALKEILPIAYLREEILFPLGTQSPGSQSVGDCSLEQSSNCTPSKAELEGSLSSGVQFGDLRSLQSKSPTDHGSPNDFWVLADDSGLCVDALGGAPGVETARYAGAGSTAAQNRAKLLKALEGVPKGKRGAHFACVLFLIESNGSEHVFSATCEGEISERESDGGFGFGYDPIFIPRGFERTFAELPGETKDMLSHRGIAFAKLADYLAEKP